MSRRHFFVPIVLACLLAGCATWSGHGVTVAHALKLRIAVLPVQRDVVINKLSDLESVPNPTKPVPDEARLIDQKMQSVAKEMTRAIEARLSASPYFEVVPHEQTETELATLGMPAATPLTPGQVERLGKALDAQVVLAIELSGYGQLKRKWITILIGSGVGEGVVQGAVVAKATQSAALGAAAMLEEIGQEILTWGGGAHLFNEHYSPVILEGRLASTTDGKTLWNDTALASIDKPALKKLPGDQQKKKEVQLRVTAEKAERELVEALEKEVKKQLPE
ncbi:MAG: hypothetical protein ACM3NI_07800 [Bacteroidota bacterium]